jgi:ribosome-binding protein aMBF1 (putative translation factor)
VNVGGHSHATREYACVVATRARNAGSGGSRPARSALGKRGSDGSAVKSTRPPVPATRRPSEPPELRAAIGERIALLRTERGLTQAALAEKAGRRKSWLAKIERGQRSLLFSEAVELTRQLTVKFDQLWPWPPQADSEPAGAEEGRTPNS